MPLRRVPFRRARGRHARELRRPPLAPVEPVIGDDHQHAAHGGCGISILTDALIERAEETLGHGAVAVEVRPARSTPAAAARRERTRGRGCRCSGNTPPRRRAAARGSTAARGRRRRSSRSACGAARSPAANRDRRSRRPSGSPLRPATADRRGGHRSSRRARRAPGRRAPTPHDRREHDAAGRRRFLVEECEQPVGHDQALDRLGGQRRPEAEHRDVLPAAVAMFQSAGARRSLLVIGSFWPVTGSNCTKSRMPCSSGLVPVIMVVQMSGESAGESVLRWPLVPSARQAAEIRHHAARRCSRRAGTSPPHQGPGR